MRGIVAARADDKAKAYEGATVALILEGRSRATALAITDAAGRFAVCVPPGKYAITATAPNRAPFYLPPQLYSASSSRGEVLAALQGGGAQLGGTIAFGPAFPAGTCIPV